MKNLEKGRADKLFNFRPIFFTAVALSLGILFGYFYKFYGVSLWWLCLLLPIAGASFCFCSTKRRRLRAVCAWLGMCLFFLLGWTAFSAQVRDFEKTSVYDGEYYVVGKVVERKEYPGSARLVLCDVFIDGNRLEGKLNATLPLSFYENTALSDEVLLYGKVTTETDFFGVYGFRSYAIGENLRYTMRVEECAVSGEKFDLFMFVRARMQTCIYAGMGEEAASVTMAVLTGDTSGMEEGLLENMRRGGIAHIFAVSGLHVGALYAFCLLLLRKTKLKELPKAGRFCFLAALLFFYGGVCGFSASIVRAIVLCLVGYAAKLFATSVDFLETLALAAIVVLFLSPVALFETGFQLSFASCLGIAFFRKRIGQVCVECGKAYRKRFPKRLTAEQKVMVENGDTLPLTVSERMARAFVSVFSVSLAAQIATAPILLSAFGYVSGWAVLLNLFFAPLISATFAFLLSFVFLACLLPVAASSVLLYLPDLLWSLALLLFEVVDFSAFALTGWSISPQALIAYYGGCVLLTDKWNISATCRRIVAATFFCAFIFFFLVGNL